MDRHIFIDDRFDLIYDTCGNKFIYDKGKVGKKVKGRVFCGYHAHFGSLLRSFADKSLPEEEAKSVKDALEALANQEARLNEIADKLGGALDEKWRRGTCEQE